MTDVDALISAARSREAAALALLRTWVEQSSYSGDVDDVNAMGDRLVAAFSLPGLQVERHVGKGVGDHLVFRTPAWSDDERRGVLLLGHHDTVFPRGTFQGWVEQGDRIQGPGVLDMKGGLCVVHSALAVLADAGLLANLPLALVCVGDEEIGSPDSAALTSSVAAGARVALVFEAGRDADRIITRRKGTGAVTLKAKGKAAHAGNHHAEGRNAIWALARWIDAAQEMTDYGQGVTVNVGTVRGGSSKNTVPELAEAAADFRFERREDGEGVMTRLCAVAQELTKETGVQLSVEGGIRRPPLERTEASVALYERYAACARAAGLGAEESPLLGGGSDANNVAAVGVPAIDGLGPRGRGFHTHDEFIERPSLSPKTEALLRFLLAELA